MATAITTTTRKQTQPSYEGPAPYKLTVRQFEKMIDAGVFPDDASVELLGGILVEQMTKNPPHDFCIEHLSDVLKALSLDNLRVREEKSAELGENWCPEPDISVVRGPKDRYRKTRPGPKDIVLLVEVSESTYSIDRVVKWHGYAAARIPVYWIVNLSSRIVEVYSNPSGRGKTARYRDSAAFGPGEQVTVVIENIEVGKVAVDSFLP